MKVLKIRPELWLYLLGLLVTFNNKTFLIIFLILGVWFFLKGSSIRESIFKLLLLSLPFEKGLRGWTINLVDGSHLFDQIPYPFYFGLAPKFIFWIILFILSLRIVIRTNKRQDWLLTIFTVFAAISTILADSPSLAIIGFVRLVYLASLYLLARHFFKSKNSLDFFRELIVVWLLFWGIFGSLQFLNGRPIGHYLEETAHYAPLGYLTFEKDSLYRSSGTFGHPTFFGSWLSMTVTLGVGLVYSPVWLTGFVGSILALIGTYSRSGWLAIIPAILVLFLQKKTKKITAVILTGLVIFTIPLLIIRLKSFSVLMDYGLGSGYGRIQLIKEAIQMIRDHPILGVGLNHFTIIASRQNLTGVATNFLYPVHNTTILFASEMGLPATIAFTLFVISSLLHRSKDKFHTFIKLACLTFIFNSQFHTLFNQDPTLDLFIILLGLLST